RPSMKPDTSASGLGALAEILAPSAKAATPPATTSSATPTPASASSYAPRSIADLPLPRGGTTALLLDGVTSGVPLPRPSKTAWAAEIGPYASETTALAMLADIAEREISDRSNLQMNRRNVGS